MPTFQDDVAFLKSHTEIHVLSDGEGRQVAVAPRFQGRVMTSTLDGDLGSSRGWINRELISSGKILPHFNGYGGEDRFWMGPEGGQFSLFFAPGSPFELAHSYVPAAFDKEPFEVRDQDSQSIRFIKTMRLPNYSGFTFHVELDRRVRLLDDAQIFESLGLEKTGLRAVGFQSENVLLNQGPEAWTSRTGCPSIWILGIFQPSDLTTIVLPYREGADTDLGPKVTDTYFGKVPADRLKIGRGVLFFKGDGKYRSKIGIAPKRAQPFLGSWDPIQDILTLVHYSLPENPAAYVNSLWELQKDPFAGDVVNSYNDGPSAPGKKPEGPYYELETSSPAAALSPGETMTHIHRTFHFSGDRSSLNRAAERCLGAGLDEIERSLKGGS